MLQRSTLVKMCQDVDCDVALKFHIDDANHVVLCLEAMIEHSEILEGIAQNIPDRRAEAHVLLGKHGRDGTEVGLLARQTEILQGALETHGRWKPNGLGVERSGCPGKCNGGRNENRIPAADSGSDGSRPSSRPFRPQTGPRPRGHGQPGKRAPWARSSRSRSGSGSRRLVSRWLPSRPARSRPLGVSMKRGLKWIEVDPSVKTVSLAIGSFQKTV
jgi:hypothetical protein